MRSSPDLLWQPIQSRNERDLIEINAAALSAPASRNWILARVAALLTGYYAADAPAEVIRFEAEDWHDALKDFPEWAITKAVRWWKGEENADRRKRPVVGDIAARARFEMGPVIVARLAVQRFDAGRKPWQPEDWSERKPADASERQRIAAEILGRANVNVKRMDAAE